MSAMMIKAKLKALEDLIKNMHSMEAEEEEHQGDPRMQKDKEIVEKTLKMVGKPGDEEMDDEGPDMEGIEEEDEEGEPMSEDELFQKEKRDFLSKGNVSPSRGKAPKIMAMQVKIAPKKMMKK